jgi:hypothetical protein
MAEKLKSTIITAQQRRMAELLLQGEKTITDCYIEAYNQTPEQCENKANLYSRARNASLSKGVETCLKQLQEAAAVEEARLLVWDKRRATKRLLEMCREIEVNVAITRKLRDKLMEDNSITDVGKLNQMLKVAQICNDTSRAIKECIREMNEMYGLTKPEVSLGNAVQVIIGGVEQLPDDTID